MKKLAFECEILPGAVSAEPDFIIRWCELYLKERRFLFIPYAVDVPFNHRPLVNWLVFGGVIGAFVLQAGGTEEQIRRFVLDGWAIKGLFGHIWLHANIIHLIGNLVFLWLFGNAVCSKIGNIFYLPVYLGLGLLAGVGHLIFDGEAAVGASGAINGIVGMYLVFFPENSISCFFLLFMRPVTFSISGCWIILLWFVFDILGAVAGSGGVAYFAHIGGFIAGFGLAVLMLSTKWVVMERDEKSLLQMLGWGKRQAEKHTGRDFEAIKKLLERPDTEKAKTKTTALEPEKPKNEFIWFSCQCGQKIKVHNKYAGKAGRCPKCSQRLQVPGA